MSIALAEGLYLVAGFVMLAIAIGLYTEISKHKRG
jgi:hypothetical protein